MFSRMLNLFRKRSGEDRHFYTLIRDIFGITPNNIDLYKLALVHRSASVELPGGGTVNNERLEFLGDAVLESIVSDFLFVEFPAEDEGFLTRMRSRIVSRSTLNELCVSIGLAPHIISQAGGNFVQKHIHGDALEAMIGAIYLDKGYNLINRLVINDILRNHLDLEEITLTETDYKSRLIEWSQKNRHQIHFETSMSGKSTNQNPNFKAIAIIDGIEVGYGFGDSKKEAEQSAAFSVSQVMSDKMGDSLLDMIDHSTEAKPLKSSKDAG